jgi:hypothetical protein
MVTASALTFQAPQICGDPHNLITQRILGNTQIVENEMRELDRRKAKDPRTEIVRGPFVTLDVRK